MPGTWSRTIKGWLTGCGTAAVVIAGCMTGAMVGAGKMQSFLDFGLMFLLGTGVAFAFTCVLTGIPSVLVIWLSEKFRLRSILLYACAGALIGASSDLFLFGLGARGMTPMIVAAGAAAGLAYWRIAGRHSGQANEVSRGPL